jgi:adenosylhomocysteine nucleosidase
MFVIFCAFGAEFEPLRARLDDKKSIHENGVVGCLGRLGNTPVALVKTGIGVRNARATAGRALQFLHEVDLVIATGVAGALREGIEVGGLVLADRLLTRHGETFEPELILNVPRDWFETFAGALSASRIAYTAGAILTSRRALALPADKRAAATQSGAVAVDMESAIVALEAQSRGLPFVCLRTILDTASEEISGALLADENGRVRKLAAARALLTSPSTVRGAIRLTRNLRLATKVLSQAIDSVVSHIGIKSK